MRSNEEIGIIIQILSKYPPGLNSSIAAFEIFPAAESHLYRTDMMGCRSAIKRKIITKTLTIMFGEPKTGLSFFAFYRPKNKNENNPRVRGDLGWLFRLYKCSSWKQQKTDYQSEEKMTKITTVLFVALFVIGSLPVFSMAQNSYGATYPVYGRSSRDLYVYLNVGHNDVLISGDGSGDVDLFVYEGNGSLAGSSRSYSDDEKVCIPNVVRAGYFLVRIQNAGYYANDVQLRVKNH